MEILSFVLVASDIGGCNSHGAAACYCGIQLSPPMALTAVGSQFPRLWSWREGKEQAMAMPLLETTELETWRLDFFPTAA